LSLISKWNKAYNLTAIVDPKKMVTHHLLDSLAIQPYIQGHLILDVGTGAGLPGIPLAIANPNKRFVLLDSLQKRITFLQQVIYDLQLENVTVVQARVEDYQNDENFDQIITRAFASLPEMLMLSGHLASGSTQFLAMKGGNYQEELELLLDTYTITGIHRLNVPGLDADRHLLIIEGSHNG
jgi:16S rRNA (guanine527-N7)-methyltransferase